MKSLSRKELRSPIQIIFLPLAILLAATAFGRPLQSFQFYAGADYDPDLPTLKQVTGHDWGEQISTHAETEAYFQALDRASDRVQLVEYARSWEGRALYYAILGSSANLERLESIREGMQRLAYPQGVAPGEAEAFMAGLPSIVWLSYGVHGDEISSTDAATLLAYHLAASRDDRLAEAIIENSIVIIDPLQNPDGRDRFVHFYRQTRGALPDPDPQAAEHNEPWPTGRVNHYLFDMNRDWFALTQPETRGRVRAFLDWFPQVYVDLHEMGHDSTYYFAPPAPPLNPEFTPSQVEWLHRFGQGIAQWFDRMGWDYFTREVFDSFYPGYGEGWPMFHGSTGMTFEQASVAGLVIRRTDETMLHYRDSVQHHFYASLATCQTAAENRLELLRSFYEYRRSAIEEGRNGIVKEFIIPPGPDANRTAKLAALLSRQGIEVQQALEPFANGRIQDPDSGEIGSRDFPAGTYIVPLAQPAQHLVQTLLQKQTPMEERFVEEQVRRREKRLEDQIYDVTAWSLPLLYDVAVFPSEEPSRGNFSKLESAQPQQGDLTGGPARVAYLIAWGTNSALRALAMLLEEEIRVLAAGRSFEIDGISYPAGSLIVRVAGNPADLQDRLRRVAKEAGVSIRSTDSSWVSAGVSFGSEEVRTLVKPAVAMAYNIPTRPGSAGAARYILEQMYGLPVTVVRTSDLPRADLSRYNVLILPDAGEYFGGYDDILGTEGLDRIRNWVEAGGTLITIGAATVWASREKTGLLETSREYWGGTLVGKKGEKEDAGPQEPDVTEETSYEEMIQPLRELPPETPGALFRVQLDTEHWLAFGYDGETGVLVESRNIFRPLRLDKGHNVGIYAPPDRLLLSGFTWDGVPRQAARKAFLMHQEMKKGHLVAFAEDPNYRAFLDGLNRLFLNAIYFGPAY